MKIRRGLVSNSSSSSFVIIREGRFDRTSLTYQGRSITLPLDGQTEFGWEIRKYKDFESKVNFAAIQVLNLEDLKKRIPKFKEREEEQDNPYWQGMVKDWEKWTTIEAREIFETTLREVLEVRKIQWDLTIDESKEEDKAYGYIDHQSSAFEGQNLKIFESVLAMKNFLFSPESYIQGGNDNW